MRYIFTCFCLFMTVNFVSAQRNFKPAIIELITGEKISGLIDYKNWEKNPKAIQFKKSESSELQDYTIKELAGFQVAGEDIYIKADVWKDVQPVLIDQLVSYEVPPVKETVFLRLLVHGDQISLYELVDSRDRFYIKPAQV